MGRCLTTEEFIENDLSDFMEWLNSEILVLNNI